MIVRLTSRNGPESGPRGALVAGGAGLPGDGRPGVAGAADDDDVRHRGAFRWKFSGPADRASAAGTHRLPPALTLGSESVTLGWAESCPRVIGKGSLRDEPGVHGNRPPQRLPSRPRDLR